MSFVKGFVMSLGMFSIIPVPISVWNEKNMPMVIPCLPLVGALIGVIWYTLACYLLKSPVSSLLQSAVVLFIPFVLSGFIHADGYMDTADAVFSRGDLNEKRRILKDPNVGAFAVFAVIGLILFEFCAVHTIVNGEKPLHVLAFIPAVSRCVAGIALLCLKPAFETGYSASFRKGTSYLHTMIIILAAVLIFLAARLAGSAAFLPLFAGVLTGVLAVSYLYKQFKGISGDLCGCIITVSEFSALLCAAVI